MLVEGSPVVGKTTFCLKIAHDWANKATSKVECFPQFEVILLLKCHDIHGDIKDAIRKELIDYIEDFHYQGKVLIILNGLDELPEMSESCMDRLLQKEFFHFAM